MIAIFRQTQASKVRRFDMLALTDFQQASHRLQHATGHQMYLKTADAADEFGLALASLGDIDKDGYSEFAVASTRHKSSCTFINIIRVTALTQPDLLSVQSICHGSNMDNHYASISLIRQHTNTLHGHRRTVFAIGIPFETPTGAVHVSTLDHTGELIGSLHTLHVSGLSPGAQFGASLTSLGDINGDGFNEILVGAPGESAVYVVFLDSKAHVTHFVKHQMGIKNQFGRSMTTMGDINNDTIIEVLVSSAHTVHMIQLSPLGEITENIPLNLPTMITRTAGTGNTLCYVGFDEEDNPTFAIGNRFDNDGGKEKGAIWVATIDKRGNVVRCVKYSETQGNLDGKLETGDHFGASVATVLDVNKDGFAELLVGIPRPPPHLTTHRHISNSQKPGVLWILDIPGTKSVRAARMNEISPNEDCIFNKDACTCLFRQRPLSKCLALADVRAAGVYCYERYCSSAFECGKSFIMRRDHLHSWL